MSLLFGYPYGRIPPAVEIGKLMIAFCYQKDDVCYVERKASEIIADSYELFRRN